LSNRGAGLLRKIATERVNLIKEYIHV
jgi:hypothetical protein